MIAVNDTIPDITVKVMDENGMQDLSTGELFRGKKVLLFSVPGAFTPVCSEAHLPGYVVHADDIKAKGVDEIVCMSVNDAFVMSAWGKKHNADEVVMMADGNADFAKALGLEFDGQGIGFGTRSQRFALIAENGVVKHLNVESSPGLDVSSVETMMALL